MISRKSEQEGERIAKRIARAGLCSRREAEQWIFAGRVEVNGNPIASPALNVSAADRIKVDGKPLPERERTRLFLYHKPRGLVTSARDPEGRPTLFERLPKHLPRLVSIGRLDLNSEGLLLLTNDGGLARVLELPKTGWLRRYRVRASRKRPPRISPRRCCNALQTPPPLRGRACPGLDPGSTGRRPVGRGVAFGNQVAKKSGAASSPTARAAKSRSSASGSRRRGG